MKKAVRIVLVLLLLTCTYRYAQVVGTGSYVQEAAEENCAYEMDEEAENEIISKMKVTVGEALKIAELAGQEEPEETEESEVQRYYREAVESAQLDWEWVFRPGYADDFIFLGGTYIAVRQNDGKYRVIDENGVLIFSEEYDSISPYSENIAKACNDGKYFYIDKMGERVIEGAFQDAKSFFEKRAAVQMEGSWGYINSDGRVVIECRYEQANAFKEGYAGVKNESGWGFIDRNGRMTVSCQYDEVKDYSEGLAAVKKDGKWGYIDETGQVVIDLMYDDAGSFSEGKAAVKLEDYTEDGLDAWSYINSENTVVLGPYIDWQIPAFSMHAGEFHDGLAYVVDEVPTIINEKGEEVFDSPFFITGYVDSKYKAIPGYLFADDLMKERTYGLVGLDGKCLLEPVFYDVDELYEDYVMVEVIIDKIPCKGVIRLKEKQPDKNSSLLWKSWIEGGPISRSDKFGFIITKMSGEEIEGVIVIGDDADGWYWAYGYNCEMCKQFKGIVKEDRAECTFEYEGYPANVTFFFQGNNRIEAAVKCDQLDMDMCHEFRPKHFSDIDVLWNDDLSSVPVYLETWGEVNLISATTNINHPYPVLCITDEDGNVLYEGGLINGFDFWDIFVEDLNQDGLQDIWTVLGGYVDDALETGTLVDIFYQTGDGRFYHTSRRSGSGLDEEYLGEYLVTRFCPTGNYVDISETILTQEEAEQMIGKKIVIQEKLFVSYDSERRLGVREDRKPPVRESMIIEYNSTYPEYDWKPLLSDMDSGESYTDAYPDEELREAVGEEYYEKISGVFYDMYAAWQQFYTLEGEDKLIMHSMLTGQNFILEKEIADN